MEINVLDMLIIILLGISIYLWTIAWFRDPRCPAPQIIYRTQRKPLPLDVQFSESNFASNVFSNLFTQPNVWIGGMQADSGRSSVNEENKPEEAQEQEQQEPQDEEEQPQE